MAKKNEGKQKKVNKLIGGINRDVNPIDQPPGTYRYAYNAINSREIGAISNERGTESFSNLPAGYLLVGSIVINDLASDIKFVVFLTKAPGFGGPASQIGSISFDGGYTTLLHDIANSDTNKLNFTTRFPIEGEYKINATGEVSIYWTDDNSVPRYLNLTIIPPTPFVIEELDLFPKIQSYPQTALSRVRSSTGNLRTGAYQLTVAYMTEDGAVTSYLEVSNPVYINDEAEGGANSPTNSWGPPSLVSTNYNGADGGTPTSKSIEWNVSNLDTSYEYLVPCVVRTIDGAKDAVVLEREHIPTTGTTSVRVIYTGYEEAHEEILAAVQIPKESYTKAKTVAQVDDILYWGNLEKQKIDIGYQKFANNIRIFKDDLNPNFNDSETVDITGMGSVSMDFTRGFGVDGFDSSMVKGYKKGEVYAFYITWVLKDGSETVAYHIPGRPPLTASQWHDAAGNDLNEKDNVTPTTVHATGGYAHPFASQITHWGSDMPLYNFHWKMNQYNTTHGRGMGYWENNLEQYPNTTDFDIWKVDPWGNSVWTGGSLQGLNVRHHHIPLGRPDGGGGNIARVAFKHTSTTGVYALNPTGIKINNVPIPDFCVADCVAYKIYYLQKGTENMVCLSTSSIQGGRENADPHKSNFGTHWMCMPWQVLGRAKNVAGQANFSTPFFVAEPLDLMQIGESIASINYISMEPYAANIEEGLGWSVYTRNSFGHSFHDTSGTHMAFDWSKADLVALGTTYNKNGCRVLRGKTRMPSGAIFGAVSGFTLPIDNEQGTETIAFEMYDNLSFSNHYYQIGANHLWYKNSYPWNSGSNELNIDLGSAYDYDLRRFNVNFMSFKSDVHFGFNRQRDFIYTGYSGAIDKTLVLAGGGYTHRAPSGTALGSGETTMGGDVHIGYHAHDKYRESDKLTYNSGVNVTHVYAGGAMNSGVQAMYGTVPLFNPDKSTFKDYVVNNFISESRVHAMWRHSNNEDEAYYPAYEVNHQAIMGHNNPSKKMPKINADYLLGNNTRLLRSWNADDPLQTFTDFPTRIIRSVKYNQSGLEDNFRVYLPEDFRDLPRHRGELWKVQSFNNIIIPHMERALYMTKGKETLQVSDVSEAFLGSGDIFEKDPAELLLTDLGHAGTSSQWAAVTSEFGYFFVDRQAGKVFLANDKGLEEVSSYGMRKFFQENLTTGSAVNVLDPTVGPLPLNYDNPVHGIGLTAVYDPELKRLILTKKDLIQTTSFPTTIAWGSGALPDWQSQYSAEHGWFYASDHYGDPDYPLVTDTYWDTYQEWTVSYDPQIKTWVSFHAYVPNHYIGGLSKFYGYKGYNMDGLGSLAYRLYMHNEGSPGHYYNEFNSPFIIDLITNEGPDVVKLYKAIDYTVESINQTGGIDLTNPFNYIGVYNSFQESGLIPVTATNIRKVDRTWFFNDFRDLATITNDYPTSITPMTHNEGNFLGTTIGTLVPPGFQTNKFMPSINSNFINTAKSWFNRRKFVDKWMGVRLISSQIASFTGNNLVSLYTVNTHKKINYR